MGIRKMQSPAKNMHSFFRPPWRKLKSCDAKQFSLRKGVVRLRNSRYRTLRLRVVISGLLLLCLCGFSFGLRSYSLTQDTAQEASQLQQAEAFRYSGLDREKFPTILGAWLKQGKYAPFVRAAQPAFPVPGLGEGYVPQGMCLSEVLGCFIIACYFPAGARPSMLALVDAATGNYVKTVFLLKPGGTPYTGHAGGAAAWEDHVWVTSENKAWRLSAKDLDQADDRSTVRFRDTFTPGTRGSIAFCSDDTLWVGEYYAEGLSKGYDESRRDAATGNIAWCAGFSLSRNAPMGVKGVKHSGDAPPPMAVLALPEIVQGACTASGGALLLSTSVSSQLPSWLLVFEPLQDILAREPARQVTVNKSKVPLYIIDESHARGRQILPPMSEGTCRLGGKIYVLFESAAFLYRKRTELYADYVFALEERLLPGLWIAAGMTPER
jgi:hypothetical protein